MSPFLKSARACCLFLLLAGNGTLTAAPPGFVEGHLVILALKESRGVELAEDGQSNRAAAEYQEYPLVVLTQDGQTEIARFTADGDGAYHVPLPPRAYILDVQNPVQKHPKVRPEPLKTQ